MGSHYPIPAEETRIEMRVSNSLFIATAARADTVEEAKAVIQRIRHEHAKATHNVHAFIVGYGSSVTEGCHDDGEPGGTAGRPMLAVLRGSGLGDTVVVVTRYFGGTKLGTGGLVRAYGDATRAVLEALPRVQKVERHEVELTVPYNFYEQIKRLIAEYSGKIEEETFSADVLLRLTLIAEDIEPLSQAVSEITAGHVQVTLTSSK
jgi:uncharacterized YigZ family protein